MKKVLIFIAGVVTGVVLMFAIAAFISSGDSSNGESSNNGMTFFEKEGDCISENSFEVFQVLDSGDALANEVKIEWDMSVPTGVTVLLLCKDGNRIMTTKLSKFLKENVQSRLGHSNTQQRQVLIRLFLL